MKIPHLTSTAYRLLSVLHTLLHIQLADDCLDRYSQYGPFIPHI